MTSIQQPANTRYERCHFLDLPGELRNRIYELALVELGAFNILHLSWYPRRTSQFGHTPGLINLNRATRREALPIYYGLNVFEVWPDFDTPDWWLPRDSVARGLVKELRFCVVYMNLHLQDGEHQPLIITLKLDDEIGPRVTLEEKEVWPHLFSCRLQPYLQRTAEEAEQLGKGRAVLGLWERLSRYLQTGKLLPSEDDGILEMCASCQRSRKARNRLS